jgi:hypothetical protein
MGGNRQSHQRGELGRVFVDFGQQAAEIDRIGALQAAEPADE